MSAPRAPVAAAAVAPVRGVGPAAQAPPLPKGRAAAVSIVSNSLLIALKLAAGVITGSIAIITGAVHSSIDLIAALAAFFSVRKADERRTRDPGAPQGRRRAHPPGAGGRGQVRLTAAAAPTANSTPEYP